VSAPARIDWFVACRFTTLRRAEGDHRPWAASTAHAKRMGTTVTACGQPAATMTKLFEVAFPISGQNCPDCLAAVRDHERARRARTTTGRRRTSSR
jgi:hypothetical protein